jgi:hypothetical protein
MKLLVSVFERAKSKITSTRSTGRISSGLFKNFSPSVQLNHSVSNTLTYFLFLDSDNEFDTNNSKPISSSGPLIIQQQPRLSLSKWLCTNPSSVEKSVREMKGKKNNLLFTPDITRHLLLIFNKREFHSNNLHMYEYIQLLVS